MPASGLRAKDVALRSDAELRTLRARAKTAIMRWVDDAPAPAGARAAMSRAVDAMLAELAERDGWFEVMTVVLGDTAGLDFALRSRTWRAYPCETMLAVTTVVPGWARGWREVIPDETARDHLTWFLHYARQYIHRSRMARILMAAWDRDGRVLHPFGPGGTNQFYSPGFRPAPSVVRMLDAAEREAKARWGASARERRVRSVWSRANTLDPEIHQAVFHFIRAQSLLAHDFELEAVVALDCALQAIGTMLMRGGRLTNKATRAELCVALGLEQSAAGAAMEGSFVRNVVGAHAGGWRWWDSGEVTEELVPALTRAVRQAIGRAAAIEPEMRRVDPDPASWHEWLLVNFSTVWDSVWLPKASGSR
jgi:hypothetical protein